MVLKAVTYRQNYGARAGETIVGALARGPGGRFVRGGGQPLSGSELIASLTKKPKKGGGKGAKKLGDAQQTALGEKVGIDSEDLGALKTFAKGGNVSEGDAKRLVNLGLAERGKDGTLRMAGSSRGLLRALQKGDQRAAQDALSKGRDRAAAAAERAAKPAKAPKAPKGGGGKGGGKADAEAKRQQREQQRRADETAKVSNRLEEIETLVKQDTSPTAYQKQQRLNRLEDLERRLERAGGDEQLQSRIEALRKQLESAKELSSLAVYKQSDGSYRWAAYSTNAFRDRDGEIVSTKAIESDVARTDGGDTIGPLRWWHVGTVAYDTPLDWQTSQAGDGIDIGACDFRVLHGRMLIEGGTFKSGDGGASPLGEAVAANPGAFQMSIGFTHPADEPDSDGTYHNIRVFERSLLPRGKASNPFTSIQVQEMKDMASLKEKWDEFVKLFGGDEAKAKQFAATTEETQKEIEAAGVAFKSERSSAEEFKAEWSTAFINDLPDGAFLHVEGGGKKDEDGKTVPRSLRHFPYKNANGGIDLPHLRNAIARIPQSSLSADLKSSLQKKAQRLLAEQNKETTMESEVEKKEAAPEAVEVKADGASDAREAASAAEAPEAEAEGEGSDVTFVGDMTAEEFVALLQQALAPMLESMSARQDAAIGKSISDAQAASATAAADTVRKEIATLKESSSVTVASLSKRVEELEGDAPTGKHAGYRASQDASTITQKQMTPPQREDEISRLAAFMFGTNGKTE